MWIINKNKKLCKNVLSSLIINQNLLKHLKISRKKNLNLKLKLNKNKNQKVYIIYSFILLTILNPI
jgi:hypothetical protein